MSLRDQLFCLTKNIDLDIQYKIIEDNNYYV